MESLFYKSTALLRAAVSQSAGLLFAALIFSQGCSVLSDAPVRAPSPREIPRAESQSKPVVKSPPRLQGPRETPRIAKVPAPTVIEQAPPLAKIPEPSQPTMIQTGLASWYGPRFHNKLTASGEVFDQDDLTAAHRTLPWGTRVKVTNLTNGKSVDVRINDRGPFVKGRIIDLSRAAARELDMVEQGITNVRLECCFDSEVSNEMAARD